MAITSKIIRKTALTYRPGYDITADFIDSVTEKITRKTFFFASVTEPTDLELAARLTHIAGNVQDFIDKAAYDIEHPPVDRDEVEKILIEKGYLESNETLEDLKDSVDFIADKEV